MRAGEPRFLGGLKVRMRVWRLKRKNEASGMDGWV